jgi:hypothetical protein
MAVENSRLGRFTESFLQQSFASLPYGRPVIGTVGDFERLGRREVEEFFRHRYRPDRLTCALVGDVDPVVVRRLATQYFGAYLTLPLSLLQLKGGVCERRCGRVLQSMWSIRNHRRPINGPPSWLNDPSRS